MLFALAAWLGCAPALGGGRADHRPSDTEVTIRVRIGIRVTADRGPARNVVGVTVFPMDWPEQRVTIRDRDVSSGANASVRRVGDSGSQFLLRVPRLEANGEAHGVFTLEVTRARQHEAVALDDLTVPEQLPGGAKSALRPSPGIDSNHSRVRELVEQLIDPDDPVGVKVSRLQDWAIAHIEYKSGQFKGCLQAIQDGTGDCEERSAVFIALCRAAGIPARSVWVPGHCYSEFYAATAGNDEGGWIPVESFGPMRIGVIEKPGVILQKGDRFKPPERRNQELRYLNDWLRADGPVSVEFIQEVDDSANTVSFPPGDPP